MAVTVNNRWIRAVASSAQTVFTYDFPITAKESIEIYVIDGTTMVATLLVFSTNYTLTDIGEDAGGTFVLTSGATENDIYVAVGITPFARTTDYSGKAEITTSSINNQYNDLTKQTQQNRRGIDRSLRIPITDDLATRVTEFPEASVRANKYPHFDSSGDLEVVTASTGAANPGGSDTEFQYNNNGVLDGISGYTTNGTNTATFVGTHTITGSSAVDNIKIDGNTISSTDSNGDINAAPNGTGTFNVSTSLNVGSTIDIDGVINDSTMATATSTNLSVSSAIKAYVDDQSGTQAQGFFNGAILEHAVFSVTSNGSTITGSLEKSGGGDLTLIYSTGSYDLDTTPAVTVTLTAGTDAAPALNYIYLPISTKVLTKSTVGWPSEEYTPVAEVVCQSAASLQTQDAYNTHQWTEHIVGSDDQGHLTHINFWIRTQHATWLSGCALTANVGVATFDVATSTGTALELHEHAMLAFDTSSGSTAFVVNDSSSAYDDITDLSTLLTDSNGVSMSGKYFNMVFWIVISADNTESKLMVNLPTASYNNEITAINDDERTAVFNIPSIFRGTGFLVSRLTVRHQTGGGGTWSISQNEDLRGLTPSVATGSGIGGDVTGPSSSIDNGIVLFDGTSGDLIKDSGVIWPIYTGSFKNKIINGSLDVWIRGSTFTTVADEEYSADRWVWTQTGTGVVSVLRSTDIPDSAAVRHKFKYSLQVDVTTADVSIAASAAYAIGQKIEGYNITSLSDKSFTLSFWVKSTKTGIFCITAKNSGADRSQIKEYTIDSTDTWEKKSVTFSDYTPEVAGGTWNFLNGVGLFIQFAIAVGSNFQGAADTWLSGDFISTSNQVNGLDNVANNFRISGVQLEEGASVSEFELRAIGQELSLCKRYYEEYGGTDIATIATGQATGATFSNLHMRYIEKRATPTFVFTGDWSLQDAGGTKIATSSEAVSNPTLTDTRLNIGVASGMVAGDATLFVAKNDTTARLTIDSEL